MSCWGLTCEIRGADAIVTAVIASGSRETPVTIDVVSHRTNPHEDWAQKLRLLIADLHTQWRRKPPKAVVIRTLDWARNRREGPTRQRHQVEGAILAAAREHSSVVVSKSGKEVGSICGTTKADIEQEAAAVFGAKNKEAGGAVLAALVLADEA